MPSRVPRDGSWTSHRVSVTVPIGPLRGNPPPLPEGGRDGRTGRRGGPLQTGPGVDPRGLGGPDRSLQWTRPRRRCKWNVVCYYAFEFEFAGVSVEAECGVPPLAAAAAQRGRHEGQEALRRAPERGAPRARAHGRQGSGRRGGQSPAAPISMAQLQAAIGGASLTGGRGGRGGGAAGVPEELPRARGDAEEDRVVGRQKAY